MKAPGSSPAPGAAAAGAKRTRQIIYALAIVALFAAMYPYTLLLGRIKARRQLGEATLGQIDTGSFMLKLALLGGARGVAANVLWTRAIELQKLHEWDRLDQTINMITKLQPHFLSVWTFQGWNLAYNVSVEWDDPADKYEWIKRGIMFIRDGVDKNRKSPDLLWDTAWTYYHKLGFADEAIVLRKLLRDDDDEEFKLDPLDRYRRTLNDNFQLGHGWFKRAVQLVDAGERRLEGGVRAQEEAPETDIEYVDKPVQHKGRVGDLNFRTMPAHAQTRYAMYLEKASVKDEPAQFGPTARLAWEKALQEWIIFGTYPFPAFSHPDQMVYIDDATNPAKFATLSDPQRYWTDRWASDTNYRYWKDRSAAESERAGVAGRQLFYEATLALKTADFKTAAEKYRQGLELWKDLLERHTYYRDDELNSQDVGFLVRRYVYALRQTGVTEPPPDTPFLDLYEKVKNAPAPIDPYDQIEVLGRIPKSASDASTQDAAGASQGQPTQ